MIKNENINEVLTVFTSQRIFNFSLQSLAITTNVFRKEFLQTFIINSLKTMKNTYSN